MPAPRAKGGQFYTPRCVVQLLVEMLAPYKGRVFDPCCGSEGDIRQAIIEADLVDCRVALPGQLFYSTQIPVCLWFLARDKFGRSPSPRPSPSGRGRQGEGGFADRRGKTLFIDARKLGTLIDRVHRDLPGDGIAKIAGTYHAWRGDKDAGKYQDVAGFCMSSKLEEIRSHGHVLTPGRYVGAEEVEDDGEPFEDKMKRLTSKLDEQFTESAKLEKTIRRNLAGLDLAGVKRL